MVKALVPLLMTILLSGCCPTGMTQTSQSSRPQVSSAKPGLGLEQGRQQCTASRAGVLAMWRDQCRNPGLTDAQLRDRAEPMAARYGSLLSDADLAAECPGIVAGQGGFADLARSRGKQLADYCLDDLGFRPVSRPRQSCRQIGF